MNSTDSNKPVFEYHGREKDFFLIKDVLLSNVDPLFSIIRCWNKSVDDLLKLLVRFEHLQKHVSQFQGLCLVVNKEKDGDEQSIKNMQHIFETHSFPYPLFLFRCERYSWTAGINGVLAFLNRLAQSLEVPISQQNILIQSFDVFFAEDQLKRISSLLEKNEPIISVRVEQEDPDKVLFEELSLAIQQLAVIHGKADINLEAFFEQHRSIITLARNTSMIFRLKNLVRLGGFNPWCNDQGGMEDHEFLIRLMLTHAVEGNVSEIQQLVNAMKDPVVYRDEAWDSKLVDQKKEKMDRELQAVISITKYLKEWAIKVNGYQLPEVERDFVFVLENSNT